MTAASPILRHAARALVLDPSARVLLVHHHPERGPSPFWATPGGGLDPGETYEAAVQRELAEEVGLPCSAVGPCLWVRENIFFFRGQHYRQKERIFLVRTEGQPLKSPTFTEAALRAEGVHAHRWWRLSELETSKERFAPSRLPSLLRDILAGDIPSEPFDCGV